ncbi:MAG: DUF1318 domain-containing protein [Pseudomonadota bacterium]
MMKTFFSVFVLLVLAACHGPLVGVNVEVVDEKTLLERQILGSYDELSKDMVMLASVRGVDKEGRIKPLPYLPPGKEKALRAAQSREFNRDDIDAFKKEGCVGEGKEGLLSVTPCAATGRDKKHSEFVSSIAKEENGDRLVILVRVIETSENMTARDLPKLQQVFAQMNRDAAKPGEKIQAEDGRWIAKK